MDDEPDFNDMIEDYIEDADEPPPPPNSNHGEADDELLEQYPADAEAMMDLEEVDAAAANDVTPQPQEQLQNIPIQVQVPTGPTVPTNDLFSFERYKDSSTSWRTVTTGSPTHRSMTAKEWKKSSSSSSSSSPSRMRQTVVPTSTAPDVQLLQFLENAHHSSTTHRCNRLHLSNRAFPCRMATMSPIPGKPCRPMTLADGTRVYFPMQISEASSDPKHSSMPHHTLLGVSMEVLLSRVRTAQRKQEHEKFKAHSSQDSPTSVATRIDTFSGDTDDIINHDHSLWVDKHAPSNFAHLLSDERSNREVVRALRAWDPYVFHRDLPKRPEFLQHNRQQQQQQQHPNQPASTKDTSSSSKEKGGFSKKKDLQKNSRDKRPDESERVLLLSGPPGVGKTTLAHIVARKVGYRPIEVNGSDERSESALMERVLRAMESSTLRFQDIDKPNCLILDEIDGADAKGSIQALVNLIRADMPPKGSSRKQPYLRRPIIFICNNKFAPALKPLLPYCRQFHIGPPSSARLVARLRAILTAEKFTIQDGGGGSWLNQLVTSTGGDIRSCLYTLQFASSRAKTLAAEKQISISTNANNTLGAVTVDITQTLKNILCGEGMKDDRNDITGTLNCIFRKEKEKTNISRMKIAVKSMERSLEKVLDAVQNFGDNSRILDVLLLNIHRVSYIDPTLDKCSAAYEWLSSSDLYRSHTKGGLDTHALEDMHIPAAAGAIHVICRVEQKQDLLYTTRDFAEARYKMDANLALAHKFAEGISFRSRATRVTGQLTIETIPYALWLLSAGKGNGALNKAVTSVELLSKGEQKSFQRHVDALRTLGLSYVAEQDGLGSKDQGHNFPKLRLEPPIERFVQFADMDNERLDIPSQLKEMLSREAVHERLRDRGDDPMPQKLSLNSEFSSQPEITIIGNSTTNTSQSLSSASKRPSPAEEPQEPTKKHKAANFLTIGAQKAKAARSARSAARVGFQRTNTNNQNKLSNSGSGVPLQHVVRLRYVKGFTQAVRTPCVLEDLT